MPTAGHLPGGQALHSSHRQPRNDVVPVSDLSITQPVQSAMPTHANFPVRIEIRSSVRRWRHLPSQCFTVRGSARLRRYIDLHRSSLGTFNRDADLLQGRQPTHVDVSSTNLHCCRYGRSAFSLNQSRTYSFANIGRQPAVERCHGGLFYVRVDQCACLEPAVTVVIRGSVAPIPEQDLVRPAISHRPQPTLRSP